MNGKKAIGPTKLYLMENKADMKKLERNDIEELLCKNVPDLNDKSLYIMGGGNTTQLYQEGLQRESFFEQIEGYVNSNPKNWNKEIFGKPCVSPQSLYSKENALVFINTPRPNYIKEMRETLSTLNLRHYLLSEAILKNHKDKVLEVYDMLYDQKSKDVYANMIFCQVEGVYPDYDVYTPNSYFCWNEWTNKETGSIFVDIGAYVGDSMEQFIWNKEGRVDKIICFEPDKKNFHSLKFRTERLKNEWNLDDKKVILFPYGVSEKTSEGFVQSSSSTDGLSSKIVQEACGELIKIVALDDVIKEKVDFIKADIESYEYKMLLGAEKIIKKYEPCLAVCIYHNATDFFSIPLLIKKMLPKAKFAVRHHSNNESGTVLYAWTE